jgi:S-adenosylmethionine synthetase
MRVVLTTSADPPPHARPLEVVERKGLGHPDTLCDAFAEELSIALSRFYLERFGTMLHYNVDKVLLVGGRSQPAFGGGAVLEPIDVHLAGRATLSAGGVQVPVEELAVESCRAWLRRHMRYLDPERHVRLHVHVRPGSPDLADLWLRRRPGDDWLANDTSCGTGFAPLTPTEQAVLRLERGLRSEAALRDHPERGEDIKVMAVRERERVSFTVADAFVDRAVDDLAHYARLRDALRQDVHALVRCDELEVNCGDDLERGSIYLTVTGTSAESGDDGEAGRGNRVSGLITPHRSMTMESVAGKNPVSHVGKIYNIAATRIAAALVERIPALQSVSCDLVSQLGRSVRDPVLVHLQCHLAPGGVEADVRDAAQAIVAEQLAGLGRLYEDCLTGVAPIA